MEPHYEDNLYHEALDLLRSLIRTPSLSREEDQTARLIRNLFESKNIPVQQKGNNLWAVNKHFDPNKPTILLNSHHDTVKANEGYTRDPHSPDIVDGKLYGLGSNDAGGCLVSLIATFVASYAVPLPFNLICAPTAEEEIFGEGGVSSILSTLEQLSPITFGIVGEPTQMQMATAEKSIIVIDGHVAGVAGHAARDTGINSIYQAIPDLEWFRTFKFEKMSSKLGAIKATITMIDAGYQHNVVPDVCHYVVDVRMTDAYTPEEVVEIIDAHTVAKITPRSLRLRPSALPDDHVLYEVARLLDIPTFGSPTSSDQAMMPFSTIKMGPGMSERSHTPDEYIYTHEIKEGIQGYLRVIQTLADLL